MNNFGISKYQKYQMLGYGGVLYCTVLYCTVLYCTAALDLQMSVCVCHLTISQQPDLYTLYCTVQYSRTIVLYCIVLLCPIMYCTVLHYTVVYSTVQYSTVVEVYSIWDIYFLIFLGAYNIFNNNPSFLYISFIWFKLSFIM